MLRVGGLGEGGGCKVDVIGVGYEGGGDGLNEGGSGPAEFGGGKGDSVSVTV